VRAGARRPQPTRSSSPGSPVSGRHAHFEALLPPGVRSRVSLRPGQGEEDGSVLSWASWSPLELAPARPWARYLAEGVRDAGRTRVSCVSGSTAASRRSRGPSSEARVLEPGIRRRARSIEPRAPPSSGDPEVSAFATHEPPVASSDRSDSPR